MVDQIPCGSVLTPAISRTKLKIHSAHADSPMARTLFSPILERTSLCFTDQVAQEENEHGGPNPLWVSAYTSYLLYKAQEPFSTCRQSHGQNTFFFHYFWGGPVFASQTKEAWEENEHGGPTPLWVGTYSSYLLYKAQDPFSTCRQSHGQNTLFFLFTFREDQCLLHRPKNEHGGPTPLSASTYTSYLLYKA